ncbi:MAG: type II toxin-antitoxin system VapC family toxin [bacterium]|nr:type II toxin-antitoxin system VapC family toxin [bacterium]
MKYLIDANIIIDHLKGKPSKVSLLQSIGSQGLCTSVISVGEILEGLVGQPKEEQRRGDLETFLKATKLLDIDRKIVEMFARVRSNLRSRGKLIENFDILIAATALAHNLVLVTVDKDFEKVEGLKLKSIR